MWYINPRNCIWDFKLTINAFFLHTSYLTSLFFFLSVIKYLHNYDDKLSRYEIQVQLVSRWTERYSITLKSIFIESSLCHDMNKSKGFVFPNMVTLPRSSLQNEGGFKRKKKKNGGEWQTLSETSDMAQHN